MMRSKEVRKMWFKKTVECHKCGHIVSKDRAQKVREVMHFTNTYYYCEAHKLPYDEIVYQYGDGAYTYYRTGRIEVDVEGLLKNDKE